jgi:hypothetical protein
MYVLIVAVRNPVTGDTRELTRGFEPTLTATALSTKWSALAPAVKVLVDELQAASLTEPPAL